MDIKELAAPFRQKAADAQVTFDYYWAQDDYDQGKYEAYIKAYREAAMLCDKIVESVGKVR